MTPRRIVAVVGLVVVVVAIVIWQRRDAAPTTTTHAAGRARARAVAATPTSGPRGPWYTQRGAASRRIAGVVLDETKPVAGATVRLASPLTDELRVTTDATGRFDFGPQLALLYVVSAELPERTMALATVDLRTSLPSDDVHLVLHACLASLHGTIRDAAGGVIAGAHVTLVEGDLATMAGAEADARGNYELCIPAGGANVLVRAEGYAEVLEAVSSSGAAQRDFSLVPQATVTGRVVHASDRRAIANAVVELTHTPENLVEALPARPRHAIAGDDGVFAFDGVAPGSYVLVAKGEGVVSVRPTRTLVDTDPPSTEIICIVGDSLSIAGKVVEEDTETAIAHARISLRSADQSHHVTSQADGTFVIDHVLPGVYRPTSASGQFADDTRNIEVTKTAVADVVLELDTGSSIAGRITSQGKPVEGAQVTARGTIVTRSTSTDHTGTFALTGLREGSYEVSAESRRTGARARTQTIELDEWEHKTGVALELNNAGSIAGIVVDQNNAPVAGAVLKLASLRGGDTGVATTARDGSFRVSSLAGGGEYVYEVRPSERSAIVLPPADRKRFAPITIADGATQIKDVRVRVKRDARSIAGRVLDGSGQPAAGVAIALEPQISQERVLTDATGAFAIRNVPAGWYTVVARRALATADASVDAGAGDVVLRFPATGTIEGTLEGFPDGAEIGHITAVTSFRIEDARIGTYELVATSPAGMAIQPVEVKAGETTKVVLRRLGYGWIAGTITDPATKRPQVVVDCWCYVGNREIGRTTTDEHGAFVFPRVPAARAWINCALPNANGTFEVVENKETRIALSGTRRFDTPHRLYAGIGVDVKLGEIVVRAVVANTPAAKAGIRPGDVITAIDGGSVPPDIEQTMRQIEVRPPGVVTLTVERGETTLEIAMTLERGP